MSDENPYRSSPNVWKFGAPINFAVGDGPRSIAVGDFNGDASPDLAVAAGLHKVSVLLNQR
jgi:FG-GAP repeat protein